MLLVRRSAEARRGRPREGCGQDTALASADFHPCVSTTAWRWCTGADVRLEQARVDQFVKDLQRAPNNRPKWLVPVLILAVVLIVAALSSAP